MLFRKVVLFNEIKNIDTAVLTSITFSWKRRIVERYNNSRKQKQADAIIYKVSLNNHKLAYTIPLLVGGRFPEKRGPRQPFHLFNFSREVTVFIQIQTHY